MGDSDEFGPMGFGTRSSVGAIRDITLVPRDVWDASLAGTDPDGLDDAVAVDSAAVIDRDRLAAAMARASAIRALDAEAECGRVDAALARIREELARARTRHDLAAARLRQREAALGELHAREARFGDAEWVASFEAVRAALGPVEVAVREPDIPDPAAEALADEFELLANEIIDSARSRFDRPVLAAAEADLAEAREWVADARRTVVASDPGTVGALDALHDAVTRAMARVETAGTVAGRDASRNELERAIAAERDALSEHGVRTYPEFLYRYADPIRAQTTADEGATAESVEAEADHTRRALVARRQVSGIVLRDREIALRTRAAALLGRAPEDDVVLELRRLRIHGARLEDARAALRSALERFDAFGAREQLGSRTELPEVVARRVLAAYAEPRTSLRADLEAQVAELSADVRHRSDALDEHSALIEELERQRVRTLAAIDDGASDAAAAIAELALTCGRRLAIFEALDDLEQRGLQAALGALDTLPADIVLVTSVSAVEAWALRLGARSLRASVPVASARAAAVESAPLDAVSRTADPGGTNVSHPSWSEARRLFAWTRTEPTVPPDCAGHEPSDPPLPALDHDIDATDLGGWVGDDRGNVTAEVEPEGTTGGDGPAARAHAAEEVPEGFFRPDELGTASEPAAPEPAANESGPSGISDDLLPSPSTGSGQGRPRRRRRA